MADFWSMTPHVVPYRPEWPAEFEREKELLEGRLGGILGGYEHFGSTSVPGMVAKPIIDIQCVGLEMPLDNNAFSLLLELGYAERTAHADGGTPDPAHYARFDKISHWDPHPIVKFCLHVKAVRGTEPVLLRDYLRQHPADAEKYSRAKIQSLEGGGEVTMRQYWAGKQDILGEIFERAEEWSQKCENSAV